MNVPQQQKQIILPNDGTELTLYEEDVASLEDKYKQYLSPQIINENIDGRVESLLVITAKSILQNKINYSNVMLPENLRELLLSSQCKLLNIPLIKLKGTWDPLKATTRVAFTKDLRTLSTGSLIKVWDGTANWSTAVSTKSVSPADQYYYWEIKVPTMLFFLVLT